MLQALEARVDVKGNTEAAPLAELGKNILGDEGDMSVTADELELLGSGLWCDQGEVGTAIGRGDRHIGAAGLKSRIKDQLKTQQVHKEAQAAIQIPDKNGDGLQPQIWILPAQANRRLGKKVARKVFHGRAL